MKPVEIEAVVIGGAGMFDQFVKIGKFALAEELADQHGIVTGTGEGFVEKC